MPITDIIKKHREFQAEYADAIPQEGHKSIKHFFSKIDSYVNNKNNQENELKYKKLYDEIINNPEQAKRGFTYAAIQSDLLRRIRKIYSTKKYAESIKSGETPQTADHFDYVLYKMVAENVPESKVKEFFEQNAIANFSLTMHPTNPTSTEYTTKTGLEFDRLVNDKHDYKGFLDKLLKSDMNIVGPKKSQHQEVEETIGALDNIYTASISVRKNLKKALDKYPSYKSSIDISKPLVKPFIWATGDGDGNENATADTLFEASQLLRSRIKKLYLADLDEIYRETKLHKIYQIKCDLEDGKYTNPEEMLKGLASLSQSEAIEDLIYKIRTFGFHYAKVDIRHNSDDLMTTMARLGKIAGLIENEQDFLQNPDSYRDQISKWFDDEEIIKKLREVNPNKLTNSLNDKSGKTAKRIFSRLWLLGENPIISDKLIIAETESEANVLSAMLLLRATGSKIAELGTGIDIVTLSESVKELQELPNLVKNLIDNPLYRKHLSYRGKLIPMIAKSDTVRRSGRGAEAIQEKAIGKLYGMLEGVKEKYPTELGNLSIEAFNGGGAALQRGGGKPTETAHNYGRAARIHGGTTMGPIHNTFQGHQNYILFSGIENAEFNLEALISQNLYARAQTELKEDGKRYVTPRATKQGVSEEAAIENYYKVCDVMINAYSNYMGDPDNSIGSEYNPFNKLFKNAPWLSIIFGNVSSRPSKRGDSNQTNSTVADIKDNPVLLNNRAITVERLCAHTNTHFLSYLSALEGLESITRDEIHEMYQGSKSARDFIRNTIIALHMTDFNVAWRMLIGVGRPSIEELSKLANEFHIIKDDKEACKKYKDQDLNKLTLAWIEIYANKVAKLCHYSATGKEPNDNNFYLQTPLKTIFPEVADLLTEREKSTEFARYSQAFLTDFFNKNPDFKLTEDMVDIIKAIYITCDVLNAPEGSLSIPLTRAESLDIFKGEDINEPKKSPPQSNLKQSANVGMMI